MLAQGYRPPWEVPRVPSDYSELEARLILGNKGVWPAEYMPKPSKTLTHKTVLTTRNAKDTIAAVPAQSEGKKAGVAKEALSASRMLLPSREKVNKASSKATAKGTSPHVGTLAGALTRPPAASTSRPPAAASSRVASSSGVPLNTTAAAAPSSSKANAP